MQDRPKINLPRCFATDLFLVNNYQLILPTHPYVQLLSFGEDPAQLQEDVLASPIMPVCPSLGRQGAPEHKYYYIHQKGLNVKS